MLPQPFNETSSKSSWNVKLTGFGKKEVALVPFRCKPNHYLKIHYEFNPEDNITEHLATTTHRSKWVKFGNKYWICIRTTRTNHWRVRHWFWMQVFVIQISACEGEQQNTAENMFFMHFSSTFSQFEMFIR